MRADRGPSWKYSRSIDLPPWKSALFVCIVIASSVVLFLLPTITLSFRKEPALLVKAQAFQEALQGEFSSVVHVEARPNPGGRPPKTRQWKVDENGGFFTFHAEGFSKGPFEGERTGFKHFRVWFKFDASGKPVVTRVESGYFF